MCIYIDYYRKLLIEIYFLLGLISKLEKVFGVCWEENIIKNMEFSCLDLIIFKESKLIIIVILKMYVELGLIVVGGLYFLWDNCKGVVGFYILCVEIGIDFVLIF